MDQKNIGQVSGVNGQEHQDFSELNSLGAEQIPTGDDARRGGGEIESNV